MKKLLRYLKAKFTEPRTLLSEEKSEALQALIDPLTKPSGRVVKHTRRCDYTPDNHRKGGRIVRAMPKQLQQIREAQEKLDDAAL